MEAPGMSGDVVQLATDVTPYVTAAAGAYGGAVHIQIGSVGRSVHIDARPGESRG